MRVICQQRHVLQARGHRRCSSVLVRRPSLRHFCLKQEFFLPKAQHAEKKRERVFFRGWAALDGTMKYSGRRTLRRIMWGAANAGWDARTAVESPHHAKFLTPGLQRWSHSGAKAPYRNRGAPVSRMCQKKVETTPCVC